MSLLHALREAPVAEQKPTRWVTMFEADPSIEVLDADGNVVGHAPALKLLIEYCDDGDWAPLSRKYRPRNNVLAQADPLWVRDLPADKRVELIAAFYRRFVKGAQGMTRENLPRFCPKAMEHVDMVKGLPEGELTFDRDLLTDLAVLGTIDFFFGVWIGATSLAEFGSEVQAKND